LENPSFLGKKLQDIRWKEKDWIPIFMGMTEGGNGNDRRGGRFTLTLTLSPQGRGEDSITQWKKRGKGSRDCRREHSSDIKCSHRNDITNN